MWQLVAEGEPPERFAHAGTIKVKGKGAMETYFARVGEWEAALAQRAEGAAGPRAASSGVLAAGPGPGWEGAGQGGGGAAANNGEAAGVRWETDSAHGGPQGASGAAQAPPLCGRRACSRRLSSALVPLQARRRAGGRARVEATPPPPVSRRR